MIAELQALGINVRHGQHGNVKTLCPQCSHTRKHKSEKCLSVHIDKGVFNCKNCGWAGTAKPMKPKKEYSKPPVASKQLGERTLSWFTGRGISYSTLQRFGVTEGVEWMPQVEAKRNCIFFNYILEGELVNIKYRDAEKNFKLVPGAQLSLFGIDVACDNSDENVLITEGEIDTLSFYEAGVKVACSVPNGASKGNAKLEWLEEMLPYLDGKNIFLATDVDEAGLLLREELARRLGKSNCWIVEYPEGCKDGNETLLAHGPDVLRQCYMLARPYPVEGIEDASSSKKEIIELFENGLPQGCGIGYDMDENFKYFPGQVTMVTGIPSHGKSTFIKNVMVRLARQHGWPFFIYSGEEGSIPMAISDLISIDSGKTFFRNWSKPRITKEEIVYMTPFMGDHFKYYQLFDSDTSIEGILTKAEEMVKRYGVRGIVIDNMSSVEKGIPTSGESRHNAIGSMMNRISKFARNYDAHVFIVAHPRKMTKLANGLYAVPQGYDIGDSSHWYNLPDNGMTVYRNFATGQTEVHRWKVRFKYTGDVGVDFFQFDPATSRFLSAEKINNGEDNTKFIGQPYDANKFAGLADTV